MQAKSPSTQQAAEQLAESTLPSKKALARPPTAIRAAVLPFRP